MHEIAFVAVVVTLTAVVGVVTLRRRRPSEGVDAEEPSHSLVRILTTDEEVRRADLRAASFEELAAASVKARTHRYHLLARSSEPPSSETPPREAGGDVTDPSHRAA